MSTFAEQLIQRGRQEGRQEGRQAGWHEGQLHGQIQLCQQLLGLPVTSVHELANWEDSNLRKLLSELQNRLQQKMR